jgi:hypothetical protein
MNPAFPGVSAIPSVPLSALPFSPPSALLLGGFGRMKECFESEGMTFVVNGEAFVVPLTEALVLSSKVCESV